MAKKYTQQNVGLSVSTPLGEDKLILRSLRGEDRLSGLFHYQLELLSEEPDLDMTAIVGQPVTAKVAHGETEYFFNGVCSRFVQVGSGPRFTTYYAELRPWLWMLTMVTDSRIFQEKSVPEIIEQIFNDNGFSDFKNDLKGSYDPRDYCVQYQESSFNFVTRLMEDEGIFYFFEHEDGKHTLVLADDLASFVPRDGQEAATVSNQTSVEGTTDIITHLALEQQVTVGAYAMTDYNFEKPAGDLKTNVEGEDASREVFEYPGGYMVKGSGESRVKLRIEAHELQAKTVRGQSHCRGFMAGYKMEVAEHVRADLNGEYVLRWVSHNATFTGYSNSFEAFPADVPFRPPVVTRKPSINSTQTAKVVGKSGEEIWTDKYGRIKVKFFWDRLGKEDETASCWIRVSQGWAGKGWGAFFLPRIGMEVIVSFLEGDPDRPVVTGAVYNAEQTVPYALPDNQTKSTHKTSSSKGNEGFNELRFEDKKGKEEVYVRAQKDMNTHILNNETRSICGSQTVTIGWEDDKGNKGGGNRIVTIKAGDETFTVEKGKRTFEVTEGDETYTIGGKRTVTVKGAEEHVNKDKFDHKVTGNYTLKCDGDITIEAGGKIKMKSGTGFETEAGTSMAHKAGTSMKLESGTSFDCKSGTTFGSEAGVTMTTKASASMTVDGGGMLTLKGGLVKIN